MTEEDEEMMALVEEVRDDPLLWFESHGWWKDEISKESSRGPANIYQRRVLAHLRWCMDLDLPCRIAGLKYRRAGSSTIGNAGLHFCGMQHKWRMAVIGTDYKASTNMLEMVEHFAAHDDFPGWSVNVTKGGEITVSAEQWSKDGDSGILERSIATRIDYAHGASVELFTAENPKSARSSGLNAFLATEVGHWPNGGEQDAGDTLTAMRNALPKTGFHFSMEESTAKGAAGAFYNTCRSARWPSYATWSKQWETTWPLEESQFGADLQPVFIFAAWWEDDRHWDRKMTPEMEEFLKANLDSDEKQLIARYQQDGPNGPRLGAEVSGTVWQQLAWRRGIIKNVCTKGGKDEFAVEYPSSPDEAFRASGHPALDREGLMVLEAMCRDTGEHARCFYGQLSIQQNGAANWSPCDKDQATIYRWEEPIIPVTQHDRGGKYLVSVDSMSGAEDVTSGNGEKDRHSVTVWRDAYTDHRGAFRPVKMVARIRPPCEWESEVLARQIYALSVYYGGATIAVEASSSGVAILKTLSQDYNANVWQREELDLVTQRTLKKLGWMQSEPARRVLIATLQKYVREQMFECRCPHMVGELLTLIINAKGKAVAGGSNHDDDAIGAGLALELIHAAHEYPSPRPVRRVDRNALEWR